MKEIFLIDSSLPHKEQIKLIRKWVKENFIEPVYCPILKAFVEINPNGIEHSLKYNLSSKAGNFDELVSVVPLLDELISIADNHRKEHDKKERKQILCIHKIEAQTIINGKRQTLEIVIREILTDEKMQLKKHNFYNHKFVVDTIKKTPR